MGREQLDDVLRRLQAKRQRLRGTTSNDPAGKDEETMNDQPPPGGGRPQSASERARGELNTAVERLQAADPSLRREDAIIKAMRADPALTERLRSSQIEDMRP